MVKVGYACGVCPRCGKKICRPRPADYAVCDCWTYCPLDGKKMEPFNPSTYTFYPYALEFDGVDDYVDCGSDVSLDVVDEITAECWFKSDFSQLYTFWLGRIGRDGWWLQGRNYGAIDMRIRDDNGNICDLQSAGNKTVANSWHHVVGVFSGISSIQKLYVDGIEVASRTPAVSSIGIDNVLRINYNFWWSYYSKSIIDNVRVYNRTLLPEEILQRYKSEEISRVGLVLDIHFNEKTAEDHSGQGNDGTVYGAEFIEGGRPIKNPVPTGVGYDADKGLEIIMWHNSPNDHAQPYYSKQKPIEVHLT